MGLAVKVPMIENFRSPSKSFFFYLQPSKVNTPQLRPSHIASIFTTLSVNNCFLVNASSVKTIKHFCGIYRYAGASFQASCPTFSCLGSDPTVINFRLVSETYHKIPIISPPKINPSNLRRKYPSDNKPS